MAQALTVRGRIHLRPGTIKGKSALMAVRYSVYRGDDHLRRQRREGNAVRAVRQSIKDPLVAVRMRSDVGEAVIGLAESAGPGTAQLQLHPRKQSTHLLEQSLRFFRDA